jgi:hypothetical protein
MLYSLKKLYGNKLGAADGDIGHVKDFYFDDRSWVVRYVVADTSSWLPGRQVLLSPRMFGKFNQAEKLLAVKMTRKQIEDSPSIEAHKPISRQYEEEYHRYYGWPFYWLGDGLWGMSGTPILESPPTPVWAGPANVAQSEKADQHLRSTHAVKGYHVKASDGMAGQVSDFRMDDKTWAIAELVVKTGHLFTGKEVPISVAKIDRINYEESTMFANLTQAAVEQSPEPITP